MIASFVLFNIGFWGPLAGMDAAWLPLIVGTVGGFITLARCVQCAWRTSLDGLPAVGGGPLWWSRLRYRALITGLHLLQPLARFRGRLRGMSRPQAIAPEHATSRPWKSPMPTFRDVIASVRFVARSGTERSFWSESWVQQTRLLSDLVGVLRAARPAQVVEVDEGWRPDRDVSVAVGRWGWLHVQTVMEEHRNGACLLRIRARLRPSFLGTLRGATVAVVVASGMSASMFIYDMSVTLAVSAVAIVAIGARAAWQAIRGATVLDRAIARVTEAAGLARLPISPEAAPTPRVEPSTEPPVDAPVEPAFEAHVEPALRRTAGAPPVRPQRQRAPQ
jgi:hypothetical protein